MKSLKLVIAALALSFSIATPLALNAQDAAPKAKQDHEHAAGKRKGGKLMRGVNLTEEQKPKVAAIREEAHKQIQALSKEERREKAPAILEESNQKIRALLTPEQQTKYDENLKKAQQRHNKKGKGKTE